MRTIFATLDPDLQPVELPRGQAVVVHWQKIVDASDVAASLGMAIGDFAPVEQALPATALDVYGPTDLERLRIQVVEIPDPPEGQQLAGYELQVDEGPTISAEPVFEPIPEPPTPGVVSMLQARLALLGAGMLAIVEAAVAAGDEAGKIYWAHASHLHRDHPLVALLAGELNLTEEQVDELFRQAALLS